MAEVTRVAVSRSFFASIQLPHPKAPERRVQAAVLCIGELLLLPFGALPPFCVRLCSGNSKSDDTLFSFVHDALTRCGVPKSY